MKTHYLMGFMAYLIAGLDREQRDGTAHVYRSTLNRLRKFMKGKDITFNQLTAEWLIRFERDLIADQLKWNTISTYMRMLRSVYNQAVEYGVAPYVPRLFSKVHTGVDSPVKRAIKPETMRQLIFNEKPMSNKQAFSCDIFILLFLLRGMSFVDLAYLRKCDLNGNVITYRRHKTGRKMDVIVGKEAMDIIHKYMNTDPNAYYLFPIINRPGMNEYQQYTRMLRLTNYRLTQVAKELKLKERITTYTARHTWATTALRQNYNTRLICDAMGHSSVKVTETYFQRFREDEVNRMNRSVVSYILSSSK